MSNDFNELKQDLEELVGMVAVLESAKENFADRSKEIAEKYENSSTFDDLKASQLKRMATILYKDSLEEEKAKAMTIFDILEQIED